MKYTILPGENIKVSRVGLGAMRIAGISEQEAAELISCALDAGINFFDHADIYGGGHSEEVFAAAMKRLKLGYDQIVVQSKCGICPKYYDLSAEHILSACEGILSRLGTDHLDVLLLHRPDALGEPEEIAKAFERLHDEGKVRCFGVSNHSPSQIELLQRYVRYPIVVNQMQLSVTNAAMIASGINVNTGNNDAIDRDGGVLDYCRLKNIHVQAWSPLQFGAFQGAFVNHPQYEALNEALADIAAKHGVEKSAVAIAWLLRHPAMIQPILGTTSPRHLTEAVKGMELELTRQDWYRIYLAAGYTLP